MIKKFFYLRKKYYICNIKLNKSNMRKFRSVIKCQAGFLTIVEHTKENPLAVLQSFNKPSTVLTIEENVGGVWLTVFATKGTKVHIASKDIYDSRTIQNYWPKSNMSQIYKPVTEQQYA